MRADNRGEGGSLALLALVSRITHNSRLSYPLFILGIFGAALFYGDSMITPAISVLSAVEGLEVAIPAFKDFVVPLTLVILLSLFLVQRYGSGAIGLLFGSITSVWFGTIALLGILSIAHEPSILASLDPRHALRFFAVQPWQAFLVLGSVVLVVTGSEALYADMGHFGRKAIRLSWFALILPALMLNYLGQGALLLQRPETIQNPFYYLTPEWALLPMVGLATVATIIASQAVISGAFSLTQQAVQLGLLPRMRIVHTSAMEIGQIYVPFINWSLLIFVMALVLGFGSSSSLAAAYGVAVTGTMLMASILIGVVMFLLWRWRPWIAGALMTLFLVVDLAFFAATATKIPHGGWFPLAIGIVTFVLLTTWKRGRAIVMEHIRQDTLPIKAFIKSAAPGVIRVPGTAVFMTSNPMAVPYALLHNLKHNRILHERVVLLTVHTEEIPHVPDAGRMQIEPLGEGFYQVNIKYGFMDDPDIPAALTKASHADLSFNMMETSFFLNRETLIPSMKPGMALWREHLFAWMSRNSASTMEFFRLPVNRVVELGAQIQI
jgi:KUP system potassium uptake protein